MTKRYAYLVLISLCFSCLKDKTPDPTCSDGIKNQGESEIDCGGPCIPCTEIIYPENGDWGPNMLSPGVLMAGSDTVFSMKVILVSGAQSTIHIFNNWPDSAASYGIDTTVASYGWSISGTEDDSWYIAQGDSSEARFIIIGGPGSTTVQYYEYGADTSKNPTSSKQFTWK